MTNMYGTAAVSAESHTSPETSDESVPDFVYHFIAAGIPQAHAKALGRRIVGTCRALRDGLITEAEAEERIDRDAGSVFISVAAQRSAA